MDPNAFEHLLAPGRPTRSADGISQSPTHRSWQPWGLRTGSHRSPTTPARSRGQASNGHRPGSQPHHTASDTPPRPTRGRLPHRRGRGWRAGTAEGQRPPLTELDLLLVIDNLESMCREQKNPARNFAVLAGQLAAPDADVDVGVVTTDTQVSKQGG